MARRSDRYDDGRYEDERYEDRGYRDDDRYEDGGYEDDRYSEDSYEDAPYEDSEDDPYEGSGYDERYDDRYDRDRYDDRYDRGRYDDRYDNDRYDERYDDRYGDEDDEDDAYGAAAGRRKSARSSSHESRGSEKHAKSAHSAKASHSSHNSHSDSAHGSGSAKHRGSSKADRSGKDKGKKKTGRIILFAAEIIILLAVIGVLYFVTRVEKVGKVDLPVARLEQHISQEVKESAESGQMKGYKNLAFFGVDSTEGNLRSNTRSDSIIICSINEDTGDVKLVSVYRDTYLNLGNDSYNKCNAAYAKGGPEQAINMLNANMDLNIQDFVTIGFGGLTDVIDALGGVEISVEQDEISHLNNYQSTMAKEINYRGNGTYTEVTSPGLQTLNGLQATAYCRIRYTTGWDYKRAARQREVLYAAVAKAKKANVAQLTEIANSVFGEIYTSLDLSEIIDELALLQGYNFQSEDTDQMRNGFPQEELRIQANLGKAVGDSVVPRSLADNVRWLHKFLFDEEDYQVSQTVQSYSNVIDSNTGGAVHEPMTDADHT